MNKISEYAITVKYNISRHTVERKRLQGIIKPISAKQGAKGGMRYFYDEEKVIHILGLKPRKMV